MKSQFLLFLVCYTLQTSSGGVTSTFAKRSLVVLPTDETPSAPSSSPGGENVTAPEIYGLDISANITNRYATTEVISKVRNPSNVAAQVAFSVVLPKQAFISGFVMEIAGKSYEAYVKEKEEARKIYDQAVASGTGAGLVAYNPRETDTFTVSVNVEPQSKVVFRLKHEELLRRQSEQYEFVINMNLGQIIEDFNVVVNVTESLPLKFVRVPSLRTGNEIDKNSDENLKPNSEITTSGNSTLIKFHPSKSEQEQFAAALGNDKEYGIKGQFIVQYDVERETEGGEILVKDGYFVHFFAPEDLEPIPKHVVFVLDYSGSMMGQKIDQLIKSMQNILAELNPQDIFHIVRFSDNAWIWDVNANSSFKAVDIGGEPKEYGKLEPRLREASLPEATKATQENVDKAKKTVKEDVGYMSSTNMVEGLEVGLFLVKKNQEIQKVEFQPIVIFLTDGFPSYTTPDKIVEIVGELNEDISAPIYSLSFGDGAAKSFLKKLSAQNHGFSRHIYEAADAALQLEAFYQQISNPLLKNVTFKYVDRATEITESHYPLFFKGSEIVIAGRIDPLTIELTPTCTTTSITGRIIMIPAIRIPQSSDNTLERLWAYLTIQQLLDERDTQEDNKELTKRATDLALKYSFVTPVTSLVVVKPNETVAAAPGPLGPNNRPIDLAGRYPAPAWSSSSQHNIQPLSISSGMPGMPAYPPVQDIPPMPMIPMYLTTTRRPLSSTAKPSKPLPDWIQQIKNAGGNVTMPSGTFLLSRPAGAVINLATCHLLAVGGPGTCTLLEDCPMLFDHLRDFETYKTLFCPVHQIYAGVCCPSSP